MVHFAMPFARPALVLAGFYADTPEPAVPELVHVGEQWVPRQYPISRHTHDVWELYLQSSGESRWQVCEETYELTAGGLLGVPPQTPHSLRSPVAAKHHFFFAAIDIPVALARLPPLKAHWEPTARPVVAQAESLLVPFRQLIREVSLTLPYREHGVRAALEALLIEASRLRVPSGVAHSLMHSHPAVLRAKELLTHHPERAWRLSELARHVGLSPQHLAERFTQDVGLPPHRFLLQTRIQKAEELLAQSDVSITELALELGFATSQHFAATFKRLTGQTAQAYRAVKR